MTPIYIIETMFREFKGVVEWSKIDAEKYAKSIGCNAKYIDGPEAKELIEREGITKMPHQN